jgi:arabinogalactan oligomer / maltooligosaccharide transport system permease protein
VSTTAAPIDAPARRSATTAAWSLPARAISYFSGPVGLAVKIVLLGVLNAIAVWAGVVLGTHHKWPAVAVLVLVTAAIDAAYLSRRTLPLKFLIPGTVFLLAFQVIPVAYTIQVAFTNYSTGHILTKGQAIDGIKQNSLGPPANGHTYSMAPARDASGKLVLVLLSDNGRAFVGTQKELKPLRRSDVRLNGDGAVVSATGFRLLKGRALLAVQNDLNTYFVPAGADTKIQPQGLDTAIDLKPTLRYDARHDAFVKVSNGQVFRDDGLGSFAAANGDELEPGWKTNTGLRNFSRTIHNRLIRAPFLRVFAWTFAFATTTVLLSFALGLFLAIALDKPGLPFQRLYRTVLIIPYAVPAFLSLLVWQGLLNDDFGVVNHILHAHVPWLLGSAWWARVSVILVSMWLTFPYFFLVSMGALQSIPMELTEAARVDGGGPWQVFRKVTLPLLLVAVAPLMIASFAFNFNNFNNIYLLTGGGPASGDQSIAGATDILISYTYKLAFASGKGNDYGLASTIAIVDFVIVAVISTIAFTRTRVLEEIN